MADVLKIVAGWVAKVADFLAHLVDAAGKALDAVKRFVDNLPKLPDLGGILNFSAVPTGVGVSAMGRSGGSSRTATGSGGVTVNVFGGDPTRVEAAVTRALRGYTRRNGTLGLAGMTGRGGIPGT